MPRTRTTKTLSIAFVAALFVTTFFLPPTQYLTPFTYHIAHAVCHSCDPGGGGDIGPVASMGANPTSVPRGSTAQLYWYSNDMTSCTSSSNWSNQNPEDGDTLNGHTTTGPLTSNTTYTFNCTGSSGSKSGSVTITVTSPPPAPPSPPTQSATQRIASWTNSSAMSTTPFPARCNGPMDCGMTITGAYVTATYVVDSTVAYNSTVQKGDTIVFTLPKSSTDIELDSSGNGFYGGSNFGTWGSSYPSYSSTDGTYGSDGTANSFCTAPNNGTEYSQTIITRPTATITPTGMSCTGSDPTFTCTVTASSGTVSALVTFPATSGSFRPFAQINEGDGGVAFNQLPEQQTWFAKIYSAFAPSAYAAEAASGHSYCATVSSANTNFNTTLKTVTYSFTATTPPDTTQPDLTAGSVSPASVTPGTATSFTSSISNLGDASTGASFSNIMQVATAANGGGTITTLSAVTMSTLAAGAHSPTTKSYTFSSAGTYSMRACADKSSATNTGTITESNENNNCGPWTTITVAVGAINGSCAATHYSCSAGSSSNNVSGDTTYTWTCSGTGGGSTASCSETKSLPDLIVSIDPTPHSATAGVVTNFTATVKNQGNASTGSTSFANWWQIDNKADHTDTSTYALYAPSMTTVTAGASKSTSQSYIFPSAGTYYVRVCADLPPLWTGNITESDEGNNCGNWVTVTVGSAPAPDLTAGSVSPASVTPGTATSFTSSISNLGDASTGASFSNIMQVATAANGGGTITTLSAVTMSTLAAGAHSPTTKSYTFSSAGTYSMRACADKSSATNTGTITESNENNNCGPWTTITVGAAVRPTASITVNGTHELSLAPGDSNTKTWSSANGTSWNATVLVTGSCSNPNKGVTQVWSPATGSASGSVTNDAGDTNVGCTSTYTYTVTNSAGSASDSMIIHWVAANAPIATLSASPSKVNSGTRATLTWTSKNATSCAAPSGNWSNAGTLAGSGLTDPITKDTTYTFQCTGPAGTSSLASATVTVTGAPVDGTPGGTHYSCLTGTSENQVNGSTAYTWDCVGSGGGSTGHGHEDKQATATLNANPSTIKEGQTSTLTWSSTNASSCVAAGGFSTGGKTGGSASTGPLTEDATYQVTCGSATAQTTVTVVHPTSAISANPALVRTGDDSTITWSSTDTSCVVSGPGLSSTAPNGSKALAITTQSTYTITCDYLEPKSVTINVTPKFNEF